MDDNVSDNDILRCDSVHKGDSNQWHKLPNSRLDCYSKHHGVFPPVSVCDHILFRHIRRSIAAFIFLPRGGTPIGETND